MKNEESSVSLSVSMFGVLVFIFFLCGFLLGIATYAEKQDKPVCAPYVQWISDESWQQGNRKFCEENRVLSVQTAMDGYHLICNCRP